MKNGTHRAGAVVVAAFFAINASGADARGSTGGAQPSISSTLSQLRSHVKYVFVLYQENRSFDAYFGTFPGAEGLYSHVPRKLPGFTQPLVNVDGTETTIQPFPSALS